MRPTRPASDPGGPGQVSPSRPLFVFNGGFLNRRIRRILELAGWQVRIGWPGHDDWIGVWGNSPTARRGLAVARRTGSPVLRVEDAFLRSIHPGRAGELPIGLMLDPAGVHFDPATPSALETLLSTASLDDPTLLTRARHAIARMQESDLGKYSPWDPALRPPDPGHVLVIDQVAGDAALRCSGADAAAFDRMLAAARDENPGRRIVIRGHPEASAGHRAGHFVPDALPPGVAFGPPALSPWRMLEGAAAVYTMSSQMGFEAILAGHRPHVFGAPFYAGWGLTEDRAALPRRGRVLTAEQLFAAAMILSPTWYCPHRDRLCGLEEVLDGLEARVAAFRQDRDGHVAVGMSRWKRRHIRRAFGSHVTFAPPQKAVRLAARTGRPILVWASRSTAALEAEAAAACLPMRRVEDGFLRSRGLGARLVPPLSLVTDDLGIHADPGRESRLDRLIAAAETLPPDRRARAEALMAALIRQGISKYNLGRTALPPLPPGRRILVPGQVEDDLSVLRGCGSVRTNIDLLRATRSANPTATILFKPHPDVEAGLRRGHVPARDLAGLADLELRHADPIALIAAVDEVWTLTSLLGFEALLRGRAVTCLGAPFYAGWGLTRDLGPVPGWRRARPDLAGLAHAALIDYPRYIDPLTGQICPVEIAVDRLAQARPAPRPSLMTVLNDLRGNAMKLSRSTR